VLAVSFALGVHFGRPDATAPVAWPTPAASRQTADTPDTPDSSPAPASRGLRPAAMRTAVFGEEPPEADVRHVADWVADSRDNGGRAFFIVDKKNAALHVFDADARLRVSSPVLLGSAIGDHTVPDIGTRPIAAVLPEERTTPAGRFVAERGRNTLGEDVVWVDYDAAVSMHRVRATVASEQRLQRLATPETGDNRISYGCINIPAWFYEAYVRPEFAHYRAVVYVLPEVGTVQAVFGSYDVAARQRALSAPQSAK